MIVEIDAEDMGQMLRRAFTTSHGKFTIYCDEPEAIGGNGTARPRCTTSPPPYCFER